MRLRVQCLPHALQFHPDQPERAPSTKVEFHIEINSPEFALMAKKYKVNGMGTAATAADKVSLEVMVDKSFVRVFYRVPIKNILQCMEEQVEKNSVANPLTFPFCRMH